MRIYILYSVLYSSTLTSFDFPQNCMCDIKPLTLRFAAPHFSQIKNFFLFLRAYVNTCFNNFVSFSKSYKQDWVFYIKFYDISDIFILYFYYTVYFYY